ncbi:TPA: hypothetical protein J4022_005581 [Escherichia coli]|nr:hypothetical protein [Escherichia coli]HBB8504059.1 hypothetical protein [Escherichia coli]
MTTAAFAWVQHGKTPLYNRGSRRHFPAQVRPEFGLKRKPRASPVAFTIGQHSLNQREILFTAEHVLLRELHLQGIVMRDMLRGKRHKKIVRIPPDMFQSFKRPNVTGDKMRRPGEQMLKMLLLTNHLFTDGGAIESMKNLGAAIE